MKNEKSNKKGTRKKIISRTRIVEVEKKDANLSEMNELSGSPQQAATLLYFYLFLTPYVFLSSSLIFLFFWVVFRGEM
jgi:hypothetical protein